MLDNTYDRLQEVKRESIEHQERLAARADAIRNHRPLSIRVIDRIDGFVDFIHRVGLFLWTG